jgi:hypothetical protein
LTFGLTGLEAIDATAQSQQEKEKVSIRTRNEKNAIMEPAVSKMLGVGYDLYMMFNTIEATDDIDIYTSNIDPVEVVFSFNDYIIKSKEDRVREVQSGLESGVYDLKNAIDYVHEDLTDEEKILLRVNSKIENGIGTFTKEEEIIYLKYVQDIVEEEDAEDTTVADTEEVEEKINKEGDVDNE